MRHLDLFSGIGGFSLAAEAVWQDLETTFCDNDAFAQAILRKHWPEAPIHSDIRNLHPDATDLVTGGFPCQPFSSAGQRRGTEDDRHLWPEMLRVIREASPHWVIGENVGGLLTWNGGMVLDQVCADLEAEGYEVWPFVIPAAGVNAPHRRDRVWIVAHAIGRSAHRGDAREYASSRKQERVSKWDQVEQSREPGKVRDASHSTSNGRSERKSKRQQPRVSETNEYNSQLIADTNPRRIRRHESAGLKEGPATRSGASGPAEDTKCERPSRGHHGDTQGHHGQIQTARPGAALHGWSEAWLTAATRLCTLDDGLPGGLARPRGWRHAALKGAGNAIVPQVAYEIMLGIKNTCDL